MYTYILNHKPLFRIFISSITLFFITILLATVQNSTLASSAITISQESTAESTPVVIEVTTDVPEAATPEITPTAEVEIITDVPEAATPEIIPTAEAEITPEPTSEDLDGDGVLLDACPTQPASIWGLLENGCPKEAPEELEIQNGVIFSVSPPTPRVGQMVTLQNYTPNYTVVRWLINADEVGTSEKQDVIISDAHVGDSTLTLVVTNGTEELTATVPLHVLPPLPQPIITFTIEPNYGKVGNILTVTTLVENGAGASCLLNMGNGDVRYTCDQTFEIAYDITGVYNPQFRVLVEGEPYVEERSVLIYDDFEEPKSFFELEIINSDTVRFYNLSTGTFNRVLWQILNIQTGELITSEQLSPTIGGLQPADYAVSLTVYSPEPYQVSSTSELEFNLPQIDPFEAGFRLYHNQCYSAVCDYPDPLICNAPCAVVITNMATGDINRTDYVMGNGDLLTDQGEVSHYTYNTVGTFLITQMVEDRYNNIKTAQRVVIVKEPEIFGYCSATAEYETGISGARYLLVDQPVTYSFGLYNAAIEDVTGISWVFGDGADIPSSDQQTVEVRYSTVGEKNASVTVDVSGLTKTFNCHLEVIPSTETRIWLELNRYTANPDDLIIAYPRWVGVIDRENSEYDFGDGTPIVSDFNANTHIYSDSDFDEEFTVKWHVLTGSNGIQTATATLRIFPEVRSVIQYTPPSPCAGFCYFRFDGSHSPHAQVYEWRIVGGNGYERVSYAPSIAVLLQDPGTYTVELVTKGDINNQSTGYEKVVVIVTPPERTSVNPTASAYVVYTGSTVRLNANPQPPTANIRWTGLNQSYNGTIWDVVLPDARVYDFSAVAIGRGIINEPAGLRVFAYDDSLLSLEPTFVLDGDKICFVVTSNATNVIWVLPNGKTLDGKTPPCMPQAEVPDGTIIFVFEIEDDGTITGGGNLEVHYPPNEPPNVVLEITPTLVPCEACKPGEGDDWITDLGEIPVGLIPPELYENVFDDTGEKIQHELVEGDTIYSVALEKCGSLAQWHKIYFDSFRPYLDLNDFAPNTQALSGNDADVLKVRWANNDDDNLAIVGQTIRATLTITNPSSSNLSDIIASVNIPQRWTFRPDSVWVFVNKSADPLKGDEDGSDLVDNRVTFDLDELLNSQVNINTYSTIKIEYVIIAPSPFKTVAGDVWEFSCATRTDLEELNTAYQQIPHLDEAQTCLAATSVVAYLELRVNDANELTLQTREFNRIQSQLLESAKQKALESDSGVVQALNAYTQLTAKIDDLFVKQAGIQKALADIQKRIITYEYYRELLSPAEQVNLFELQVQLDSEQTRLENNRAEIDNIINNQLPDATRALLDALGEADLATQDLVYALVNYAYGGFGGQNSQKVSQPIYNPQDEARGSWASLLLIAQNWQDAVCFDSENDPSTEIGFGEPPVLLYDDVTPFENVCAGYVIERRYGIGFNPDLDGDGTRLYPPTLCETAPEGSSCLEPVNSAYQFEELPEYEHLRFYLDDEYNDITSDFTKSGVRVGDAVVYGRSEFGTSPQHGHVCIVEYVTAHAIMCVGTSDEDGKLLTTRISHGIAPELTFLSTATDLVGMDYRRVEDATATLTFEFAGDVAFETGEELTALTVDGIPNSEIVQARWNFGDGSQLVTYPDLAHVTHTFPHSGKYTVRLEVTRANGMISVATREVNVASAICYDANLDIPLAECQALLAFASTTKSETWEIDGNAWGSGATVCPNSVVGNDGWYGISCTDTVNEAGLRNVTAISLQGKNLAGTLVADISDLSQLTYFDISHNQVGGELHDEFQKWSNMQHFDVSHNQLESYIPYEYPKAWQNGFTFFDVSANHFEDELSPEFFIEWKDAQLDFSDNMLVGVIPESALEFALRDGVDLSNNAVEFYDHNLPVPPNMDGLHTQQTVQPVDIVAESNLPTEVTVTWEQLEDVATPGYIVVVCDINGIDTTNGVFTSDNSGHFVIAWDDSGEGGQWVNRAWGGGGQRSIRGWGGQWASRAWGGQWVARAWGDGEFYGIYKGAVYQFVSKDATSHTFTNLVPDTTYTCSAMTMTEQHDEQLNLLFSRFGTPSTTITQNVCENIQDISEPECDALVNTYRQGGGTVWDYEGQKWFTVNSSGLLHACDWAGVDCQSFNGQPSVTSLNLSGFGMNGNIADIGALTHLNYLNFSHNLDLVGEISETLSSLHDLKEINFSHTELVGEIPSSFSNLTAMQKFDISHTNIYGAIPQSLSTWTDIESFVANNTKLSGGLPISIASWNKLREFNIEHTHIDSELHEELLEGWDSLEVLLANDTQLYGTVPDAIMNFSFATGSLQLSYARLEASPSATEFIKKSDPDFALTQTLPPTLLSFTNTAQGQGVVTLTPIVYTQNPGGYQIWCIDKYLGQPANYGTINSKSATSVALTGLAEGREYQCYARSISRPNGDLVNVLTSYPSNILRILTTPPFVTINVVDDTYISPSNPRYHNGNRRFILFGEQYIDYSIPSTPETIHAQGLLKFDRNQLQAFLNNREVEAAEVYLEIYQYGTYGGAVNYTIARTSPGAGWNGHTLYSGGFISTSPSSVTGLPYAQGTLPYYGAYGLGPTLRRIRLDMSVLQDLNVVGVDGLSLIGTNGGTGTVFCSINTDPYCTGAMVPVIRIYYRNISDASNEVTDSEKNPQETWDKFEVPDGSQIDNAGNYEIPAIQNPTMTYTLPSVSEGNGLQILLQIRNDTDAPLEYSLKMGDETCPNTFTIAQHDVETVTVQTPIYDVIQTNVDFTISTVSEHQRGYVVLTRFVASALNEAIAPSTLRCDASLIEGTIFIMKDKEQVEVNGAYLNQELTFIAQPANNGSNNAITGFTILSINGNAVGENPSFKFTQLGTTHLVIRVESSIDGDIVTFERDIEVTQAPPPVINFFFKQEIAYDNETHVPTDALNVVFGDTSTHLYEIINTRWDFGDGTSGTQKSDIPISHIYASPGNYTVVYTYTYRGIPYRAEQIITVNEVIIP